MAGRRGRKRAKSSAVVKNDVDKENIPPETEVERQCAAIRALRDMDIQQLRTMIRVLRSNFSQEELQVPVLQFFKENLPNVEITESECEVKWKDEEGNLRLNLTNEKQFHASLLHRLSTAYPPYSAAISSLQNFNFSSKTVKTGILGVDQLHARKLIMDEPSGTQIPHLKDGLQTPSVSCNRLSMGITPKTVRFPKCGEMLLSVRGSPLGVYQEDNMETILEAEDA